MNKKIIIAILVICVIFNYSIIAFAKIDLSAIPKATTIAKFKTPTNDDELEFWVTDSDSSIERGYNAVSVCSKVESKGLDGNTYIIYYLTSLLNLEDNSKFNTLSCRYNSVPTFSVSNPNHIGIDVNAGLKDKVTYTDYVHNAQSWDYGQNPISLGVLFIYEYTKGLEGAEPLNIECDYYIEGDNYQDTITQIKNEIITDDTTHSTDGKEWDPMSGQYVKSIKYDLEVPLGFDSATNSDGKYGVLTKDVNILDSENVDSSFLLKWYQSQSVSKLDSYSEWETELKVSFFGKWWKNLMPWDRNDFESPFIDCFTQDSYKQYIKCDLQSEPYKTVFDNWFSNNVYENYGYSLVWKTPNFMIRNKWYDSKKDVMHYSNWLLIKMSHDGTFTTQEIDSKNIDNTDNYKTDDVESERATDSVYDGTLNDRVNNDSETKSFIGNIKSFLSEVGEVPKLFAKIFSFLPNWCLDFIAFGFSMIVAIGVIKAVRG